MKTDIKAPGVQLPQGVRVSDLDENYRVASSEYSKAQRRARQLDAIDRGKLWSTISAKFPDYQILPDTNHISYVKNNILASIYTVGKAAKLLPTSKQDKDFIEHINVALENAWDVCKVGWYQMQAGERAALMNLGITQVGWDNSIVGPEGDYFFKGQVKLKNIDPLKFMRDPFAESIETAQYCMTWEDYHEAVILAHPGYRDEFKRLKAAGTVGSASEQGMAIMSDKASSPIGRPGYYRIHTHWVRDGAKVHELHMLNNQYPLLVKQDIKPSMFPFAELYCNLPSGDLFGTSEPARVAANSLAYNIMASIILTADYKNQRPPAFISQQSMLNVPAFVKNGNDADRTFLVSGDASRAVHYHQFPTVSGTAVTSMAMLSNDVQQVSGVDGRYTGRDTGSVLTTGGIENMLDQVTMIDAPKVECYHNYAKRLSMLIISNYIQFSMKRRYFVQNKRDPKKWDSVEVDFPSIPNDTVFSYSLNISSELPKNKSRIQAMADHLMEIQMQYQGQGIDVDLITPEEWLQFQDIPMKEYMMERMGIQRQSNWLEVVTQAVTQYAGMVEQGVDPADAISATAQTLQQQNQPGGVDPEAIMQQMQLTGQGQAQQPSLW